MQIPQGGVLFFDSGIGGLTVLQACRLRCPNEIFYYYGDNLHAPYGNLPNQEIVNYTLNAFEKMHFLRPKAGVIACNTATAMCLSLLQEKYSFPMLGIEPAIYLGASAIAKGDLLVLATCATCASERVRIIKERAERAFPSVQITLHGCQNLAALIEKHVGDFSFDYSQALPPFRPNGVVLGCTHYSLIREQISAFYHAPVFDGNERVACRLSALLNHLNPDENIRSTILQEKKTEKYLLSQPLVTPVPNEGGVPPIFFLGDSKTYNQHIFEQMFVNVRK